MSIVDLGLLSTTTPSTNGDVLVGDRSLVKPWGWPTHDLDQHSGGPGWRSARTPGREGMSTFPKSCGIPGVGPAHDGKPRRSKCPRHLVIPEPPHPLKSVRQRSLPSTLTQPPCRPERDELRGLGLAQLLRRADPEKMTPQPG